MKRVCAALLILLLTAALFAGCTGNNTVEGTYRLKTVNGKNLQDALREQAAAEGLTLEQLEAELPVGLSLKDLYVLTLKRGGDASLSMFGYEMTGTWTRDGGTVTITINGDAMDCTFANGKITMVLGEDTLVFAK